MTMATDRPTAALLSDLKARGLFDDTILLWNTEFGRMPFSGERRERSQRRGCHRLDGRGWNQERGLARGHRRMGLESSRRSDFQLRFSRHRFAPFGNRPRAADFSHNGADRRLTDVHGRVVEGFARSLSDIPFGLVELEAKVTIWETYASPHFLGESSLHAESPFPRVVCSGASPNPRRFQDFCRQHRFGFRRP